MKEPIEYLRNVNSFTTREELYNIGRQMQNDAYNEAINDVVTSVEAQYDHNHQRGTFSWENKDKNTILKLLKP